LLKGYGIVYKPGDMLCYQFNPPTELKFYYVLLEPKKGNSGIWIAWDVKYAKKTQIGTKTSNRTITKVE